MRWQGFIAVLAAASLWGIAGVVAKVLFTREAITPEAVVEIRLTAGLVVTASILWVQGQSARLARGTVLRLIPLGVAMVVSQSMYYVTISLADVATAIFLQYTAPALVVAYTAVVQRERPTLLQMATLAGAIGGGYLLVVGPHGLAVTPTALVTGLASALGFAGWIVMGRSRGRTVGPWHLLLYGLLVGSLLWSVYVPPWHAYRQPATVVAWALVLFIVIFATVLPFALFLYGLRFIDSRSASLTATVEPVVAAVIATLVLGEALSGREVAGGVLILISIVALQWAPARATAASA